MKQTFGQRMYKEASFAVGTRLIQVNKLFMECFQGRRPRSIQFCKHTTEDGRDWWMMGTTGDKSWALFRSPHELTLDDIREIYCIEVEDTVKTKIGWVNQPDYDFI